jgi:multiple sugar transport system ATP-binding protein
VAQITLENVTKSFGQITAIKDLSLIINDGEFFVLLGPTGAGKTTTLRCIAGLERPEKGNIFIDSQSVIRWTPAERDVALVFQYYSLYPHYTVRQNLEFPLRPKIRNLSAKEISSRVLKAAKTLRIDHLLDRKTENLSGGEMQRVAIGRAIVRDPKVFLMDEPLSNLDAKLREILRTELKSLQLDLGATFLYVTHDQVEAMTMGDRIGILGRGEIVQIGTPYDAYNHPKNLYVASLIGSPVMNFFDAFIQDTLLKADNNLFELALENSTIQRIKGYNGAVRIGIRAEDIHMPAEKGIKGRIYGIENLGMEKIVAFKVKDHTFRSTVDPKYDFHMDADVGFAFAQDRLHFFDKDSGKNLFHFEK